MPSYLEKQASAFRGTLASASTKIGDPSKKASLAPPSPSPSNTSDNNTTPSAKRKRMAIPPAHIPEPTSFGSDVMTHMQYAVDYIKKRGETLTMDDLIGYLGLKNHSEQHKKELVTVLRRHPRLEFKPEKDSSDQGWQKGTYAHRPVIPGVKSAESLLAYLQRKTDASGVSVKDLKDGWADCEETLGDLEGKQKILIVRTKKDNLPRYVWANDPSLHYEVQQEFREMWARVPLPSLDEMHKKLVSVGQKPTSDDPRKAAVGTNLNQKKQKKRTSKKIGKATNVHMQHLMQDYSHIRR